MFKNKSIHILFVVSLAVFLLANFSALVSIFDEWNSDGPYSHGFLGIFAVAYAFWLKRNSIISTEHTSISFTISMLGLLGSLSVNLVAVLASIQQLQLLALFFIVLFLFTSFYGFKALRVCALPFTMLLLILPVWNVLQLPLRELSTAAGQWGPELIGIAVDRDHYRLSTIGGMFDVEPACSGLGFFMVSALLAFCVSFFNKLSFKRTLTFLMICLVISIIANWLRVIIIIVVGTYTEMNHFIVHDHLTFGWIVFVVCLIPVIYIAREYFDNSQQPDEEIKLSETTASPINKAQLVITLSALIAFSVASYWIPSRYDQNYALTVADVPSYQAVSSNKNYSPNWKPYSQGASKERFFYYIKDEMGFQVYLADYVKQEQASEMIYVENYLFDKQFWHHMQDKSLTLENSENLQKVNLVVVQRSANRYRLIASWYSINGYLTSDKKQAKLAEVKATLLGQPGSTLVAVALDFDGKDQALAEKQLSEFVYSYLHPSEQ